uniref:Uncharacterized protein n=1 Tax=Anguilla anguilla TaxID=7936 RepID=A0A0E9S6C7_ANGAN
MQARLGGESKLPLDVNVCKWYVCPAMDW